MQFSNQAVTEAIKLRQKNSAQGALVADAAALGLHWLYDLQRLKQVVANKTLLFVEPDAADYEGEVGYFAHGGRMAGEQSHYGDTFLLNLQHIKKEGKFDIRLFQQDFLNKFGPEGNYPGYIDKPTRFTVEYLEKLDLSVPQSEKQEASGADDHQVPALTPVAALCACYDIKDLSENLIEKAIVVTNNNSLAVSSGIYVAYILANVLQGKSIAKGFAAAEQFIPEIIREKMHQALTMDAVDIEEAAHTLGLTCDLKDTVPLNAYILNNCDNYRHAIELNTLAGGDSCGRSIMLGAIAGAYFGTDQDDGIPQEWIAKLKCKHLLPALFESS